MAPHLRHVDQGNGWTVEMVVTAPTAVRRNGLPVIIQAALPKLHAHLESVGLPISIFTTQWFMCLFVDTLPDETLFRVWDLLVVYGPVVLVRVGTALLKSVEAELLESSDFIALTTILQSVGQNRWAGDHLLNTDYTDYTV